MYVCIYIYIYIYIPEGPGQGCPEEDQGEALGGGPAGRPAHVHLEQTAWTEVEVRGAVLSSQLGVTALT